jgi:hypothetical protein
MMSATVHTYIIAEFVKDHKEKRFWCSRFANATGPPVDQLSVAGLSLPGKVNVPKSSFVFPVILARHPSREPCIGGGFTVIALVVI